MRECPPGVHSLFDPCPGDCGDPVTTARQETEQELSCVVGKARAVRLLDDLLAEYAHDLAERQRREMRAPGRSYDASRWNRCVDLTADLIDPGVTR